jgi:hypothetical protein
MQHQIRRVILLLEQEIATPGILWRVAPNAWARKFPAAARSLGWYYLFPSTCLSMEPGTTNLRRYHGDESSTAN